MLDKMGLTKFLGGLFRGPAARQVLVINDRRYTVRRELAGSKNGILYFGGYDDTRRCVLKTPKLCFDDEDEAQFREEYDLLSSSAHRNIIAALDYGCDSQNHSPWIVMEHVDGQPFWQAVRHCSEREMFTHFRHALQACCYLHDLGIVHGDIKPDNIMIAANGELKLGDFGVATKQATPIKGFSPAFVAPEYVASSLEMGSSVAADLYSLGLTFYWLLTGVHPYFPENGSLQLHEISFNKTPAPPKVLNPTMKFQWDDYLMGLIAIDPVQRLRTAEMICERPAADTLMKKRNSKSKPRETLLCSTR